MEFVLDVYKKPYNADYPVVCMDESPKQLIEEVRPAIKMKPGMEAKTDYEYIRNGMVNIFMANEPLKGKRIVKVTEFKTKTRLGNLYQRNCRKTLSVSKKNNVGNG